MISSGLFWSASTTRWAILGALLGSAWSTYDDFCRRKPSRARGRASGQKLEMPSKLASNSSKKMREMKMLAFGGRGSALGSAAEAQSATSFMAGNKNPAMCATWRGEREAQSARNKAVWLR